MEKDGQVNVAIQGDTLVFYGKVPGKVKRAIRKRFKTDKKFREDVEKKMGNQTT